MNQYPINEKKLNQDIPEQELLNQETPHQEKTTKTNVPQQLFPQKSLPPKTSLYASMIRVNQAGEQGALDIYRGQLKIFKNTPHEAIIQEMYSHEQIHKKLFDQLMQQRHVRPTFLSPLWRVAGYGLGMVTALLGKEAAMVCTEAVEEVICDHYQQQLDCLGEKDPELQTTIQRCYEDEKMHQEVAIQQGSRQAFGYSFLSGAIKTATKLAIFLSKRI